MKSTCLTWSNVRLRYPRVLVVTLPVLMAVLALASSAATRGPFVYVVTSNNQFGTVDLSSGAFHQVGAYAPQAMSNLVWLNGSLYTLIASGNDTGSLAKINPSTAEVTIVGPTGLGSNAFDLGEVRGALYVTDFSNNLYSVNAETGATTLVRATGIPPDPTIPFTPNPDGGLNLCDESLYGVGGALYATFDSFDINPGTLEVNVHLEPALYRINPATGVATAIGSTNLNLGSAVEVNGKFYAFKWVVTAFTEDGPQIKSQLLTLELATGKTAPVGNAAGPIFVDAAAGGIVGAAPAPIARGSAGVPSLGLKQNEANRWR